LAEYDDGTRFVTDASGFELGLHTGQPTARPAEWHFGFLAPDAAAARTLQAALAADGVDIIDPEDEAAYVGFKCLDPDGHMIEVYWERRW
jgi:catechol 2,3-dioxygenase-like lactoylglutathione lyase family enzyme